jgi:alpha-ketoglutaric semialdehyde dehydrogenase
MAKVSAQAFITNPDLHEEVFGPFTLLITCENYAELEKVAQLLKGLLTASIMGTEQELDNNRSIINVIREKAGRVIFNGVPTGVEVNISTNHGGPFPATTDVRTTSVGTDAILRFVRPVTFQDCPDSLLPAELQNANPKNIWRTVNRKQSKDKI